MGAVVSASSCSTLRSSISACTPCTFTVIMRLMTHMRTGLGVLFDVVLLGKFYVHVGLGGGEGDGSVEFLAVGGEYVGHGELLVVVCEGVSQW